MDFIKQLFFLLCMLLISACAHAKAVMAIAPVIPGTITLGQTVTINIDYTVTNDTNKILNRFTIDPSFNVPSRAAYAISLTTTTCTTHLSPGATCTFQLQLMGNKNLPDYFVLSPQVCAYRVGESTAICSQPVLTNRSLVNVVAKLSGCSGNGYGTACQVMVSKNLMQGDMNVLLPAQAPDVSSCNTLNGVAKADCICSIEGPSANNGNGTWRAWLGLSTGGNNNPRERLDNSLGHPAFPALSSWVSLETGLTVYPNWGSLGITISNYPDVTNVISTSSTEVYTGGFNTPSSAIALTCNQWTSASIINFANIGSPSGTVPNNNDINSWNDNSNGLCDVFRPIYCTEITP